MVAERLGSRTSMVAERLVAEHLVAERPGIVLRPKNVAIPSLHGKVHVTILPFLSKYEMLILIYSLYIFIHI